MVEETPELKICWVKPLGGGGGGAGMQCTQSQRNQQAQMQLGEARVGKPAQHQRGRAEKDKA